MRKKFLDTKSTTFPECPQTFKSVHNVSKVFKNFVVFQNFAVFKNVAEFLKKLQSVHKLSRVYGNFPEGPETFHAQKRFRVSRN